MTQEAKVCKWVIEEDAQGDPIIYAETEECRERLKHRLDEREVTLKVRTKDEPAA